MNYPIQYKTLYISYKELIAGLDYTDSNNRFGYI